MNVPLSVWASSTRPWWHIHMYSMQIAISLPFYFVIVSWPQCHGGPKHENILEKTTFHKPRQNFTNLMKQMFSEMSFCFLKWCCVLTLRATVHVWFHVSGSEAHWGFELIHPVGTINVYTNFHFHQSNCCGDFSLKITNNLLLVLVGFVLWWRSLYKIWSQSEEVWRYVYRVHL